MALSADDIAHLLRRTEFVVKPARLAELIAKPSMAAAVDDVLNVSLNANPQVPAKFLTQDEENGWQQYVDAHNWWADSMLSRARPIQEKMTLFWHGHFTSSYSDGVDRIDHMMHQNQLYRDLALGDFLTLTQRMAIEPAMLLYLSGANNVKGAPNENFARELMELFTLGVGNYSQLDVAECARAWTGHNYSDFTSAYVFRPNKHDVANKNFFGTVKNWDGPDTINEILRDNPSKRAVAARYITKKLWEFFAYPAPAVEIIDALSQVLLGANPPATSWNIAALMTALLNRPEFYSVTAKQGLVRTPIEFALQLMHRTGVNADDIGLLWQSEGMGQVLLNPPNVAGWKSNAFWLNTSALSGRARLARHVTWHLRQDETFDVIFAMTSAQAVDHVANFFGLSLSGVSRNALIAAHQAERNSVSWDNWWGPTNLLTMVMATPEMHMA